MFQKQNKTLMQRGNFIKKETKRYLVLDFHVIIRPLWINMATIMHPPIDILPPDEL